MNDELIGKPVVVMTRLDGITYLTGELVSYDPYEVVLTRVTWHRSTGRHHQWFAGTINSTEREAFPPKMIVRLRREDCPLVAGPWTGDLDLASL
jgi:small nuclear ribonucleoprotein (snRNP)-like protein